MLKTRLLSFVRANNCFFCREIQFLEDLFFDNDISNSLQDSPEDDKQSRFVLGFNV